MKDITIWHFIILVAILFAIQYLFVKRENYESVQGGDKKTDNKLCGETSIDQGFLYYIFNSPKTPAR
jgi:uncharacterized membrane protein